MASNSFERHFSFLFATPRLRRGGMCERSEQIRYHVQMYVYRQMPVSLDQISFALFTCSMSLKGAWVHICTEICTDGIGNG